MMHRKTSQVWENYPGWCFGTFYFSPSHMGCHPSHWLMFFKMVRTTNQMMYSNRVVLTSPLVAPWLEIANWPGTCGNDKMVKTTNQYLIFPGVFFRLPKVFWSDLDLGWSLSGSMTSWKNPIDIPSGNLLQNYGKIHHFSWGNFSINGDFP